MESQPQNPEFRINPENFHPWTCSGIQLTGIVQLFSYLSMERYIVGSQKNLLNEIILLDSHKTCLTFLT